MLKKNKGFVIFLMTTVLVLTVTVQVDNFLNYKNNASTVQTQATVKTGAQSGILVDMEGNVIYDLNSKKKAYPASTTKILTVLLGLEIAKEIGTDMDGMVKIPKEAVGVEGSSLYLREGDSMSFRDLLYGALLKSGNDAATAIAILAAGDEESFVEKMNEKVKALGCKNTHFLNPTGLYDKEHYTTAEDMSKIAIEALKDNDFAKIASTRKWKVKKGTVLTKTYVNKNKTIFQYEGGNGVKIGYTEDAGRTLVASAKRNNYQLIAIVFNDGNWFNDAYKMMDYGFELNNKR